MNKTLLCALLALLLILGCDTLNESGDITINYPTIIKEKTPSEQDNLRNLYATSNPDYECAVINKYGLNDSKICLGRKILRARIDSTHVDRLENIATDFLTKNKNFTNISNSENLTVEKSFYLSGCIKCDGSENDHRSKIGIKFNFKNQVYDGLEVLDSRVSVFVDAQKVYNVYGHWFDDIVIPETDNFDHEESKKSLIGTELVYSDWTGMKIDTLNESSFTDYKDKVVLPYETEAGMELRVCNVVETPLWHLYVDTTTGELLRERLLVFF